MKAAYCVNWTEHERDELGVTTRPDGHTLHKDLEAAQAFVKEQIGDRSGATPDYYTSPGQPFLVEVTDEEYNLVQQQGTIWGHVTQWRRTITKETKNG